MPRFLCHALFILTGVALFGSFAAAFSSWWADTAHSLGPFALARRFVDQSRISQRLDAQDRVILRCLDGKHQVKDAFFAGRLTEDEVVEQFRLLEHARDEELGWPPSATGPEREARLRKTVRAWLEKRRGPGQPFHEAGTPGEKLRGV